MIRTRDIRASTLFNANQKLFLFLAFALFTFVYIRTAWVAEDAYIPFRTLEQFFQGNGLRWNPHERVQVFTSPLWFFLQLLMRYFSSDVFLNSILLSTSCMIGLFILLFKMKVRNSLITLTILMMCSSKAFMDFSTSGIENPLSSLLVMTCLFYVFKIHKNTSDQRNLSDLSWLFFYFGLSLLNRLDLATLLWPTILVSAWQFRNEKWRTIGVLFFRGMLPIIAWEIFSVIYYGFPFPCTAYAKLNTHIPHIEQMTQGLFYLRNSLSWDTPTLFIIIFSACYALIQRSAWIKWLALGIVTNLLYVVWIGGDFMSGRFFTSCFVYSLILCIYLLNQEQKVSRELQLFFIILFAISFFSFLSPIKAGFDYGKWFLLDSGIADERAAYYQGASLKTWWDVAKGNTFPANSLCKSGLAFKNSSNPVIIFVRLGYFGYCSGTQKIIVDSFALEDMFLSQLPALPHSRIGHFSREIPNGYIESIVSGKNEIQDPKLRILYDKIKLITQGELFSKARFRAILEMNLPFVFKSDDA